MNDALDEQIEIFRDAKQALKVARRVLDQRHDPVSNTDFYETGGNIRQNVQATLPDPESVNIGEELAKLREALEALELDARTRRQVGRELSAAEDEAQLEDADRESVGESVDRAFRKLQKAGKMAQAIDSLKRYVVPIAGWCGQHWDTLFDWLPM